jgi:hypothetical protein
VSVHVFPPPTVRSAAPCRFDDLAEGQVPVAVVTANPGEVTVAVGDQEVSVDTTDEEREEWDEWMQRPVSVRPASTLVAHCLVVDRPEGRGPFVVRAVAIDDDDQVASAQTAFTPLVERLAPVTVTPLDDTMVQVDVPLPPGDGQASVLAVPLAVVGAADCQRVTPELVASPAGWRRGATSVTTLRTSSGRPWLETAPRLQQVTVPLAEGETNLLCVGFGAGPSARRATLLVTPPDARRLALVATELQLHDVPPAGAVEVVATFPELAWAPCRVGVAATAVGVTSPGLAGVLCASGGDTGALAAAGGVVDVTVRSGGTAIHTARIVLSPVPGGPAAEDYRLPIPAPDLDGILCTVGAGQASCRPADAANTLGSVLLSARWDEGPVQDAGWQFTAPA